MERKLYLTEAFFVHMSLAVLLGVLSFEVPIFFWIYIAGFALVLGRTWADYQKLPNLGQVQGIIEIERSPQLGKKLKLKFTAKDVQGSWSRTQNIELRNPALKLLSDPNHKSFSRFYQGLTPMKLTSDDRYECELHYHAKSLGYEELRSFEVELSLGYWRVILEVSAETSSYRVMPPKNSLSPQAFAELSKNQRLFTLGSRRLLRGQAADQFHSIRKYQFPDSSKQIDPKKTARLGQLMTRIYDTYYNHHLVLALDVGRSMAGKLEHSQKQDFQLSACISLAEQAIQARDNVSFFAFSQKIEHSIRSVKDMRHFDSIYQNRGSLGPKNEESNYELVLEATQRLAGQRAILILFTDVSRPSIQSGLRRVLRSLCEKHLCVLVSLADEQTVLENQILHRGAQPVQTMQASSEWLYLYWLNHEVEKFRLEVSQWGGGMVSATQYDWMSVSERLYSMMRESVRA